MKTTVRVIGLLVLFLSVGFLLRRNRDWVRSVFEPESISAAIRGNVNKPGVYKLKAGDTLEDLIRVAGGMKKNTEAEQDLNREILDGQVIELKE
ncbi:MULTISPECIES: SLBB domain-containing protein [Leptospira]|uniref:Soluble ligand binding domain-containing protein n=1 Tax=Leptospira yasudae TaxID=2202201 RepID=A0A6N4QYH4_9LEPT|nr:MULTISPECIES: SLBB domain-containing protein [Leptospira]MCG6168699.1 SLBB domain-containing protein [Leptospira sanjuanensis]MCG6194115.1 SLBB domain-containing protein [Leptospira sanjuanensis]TGL77705.1 hypothetical protein EHQ72_11595 [Leptospira yasudae]TGL82680.1 hypothetical protein EHQ77_03220 [Leptospira yasudae]TGL86164.1 hypothetical protein EHQ83_06015 [Leptospira yasudae]